jgi:hypothetical protein
LVGKNWDNNNLIPTLKNINNYKVVEFEILENSKYVSKYKKFKNHLPHVNGM